MIISTCQPCDQLVSAAGLDAEQEHQARLSLLLARPRTGNSSQEFGFISIHTIGHKTLDTSHGWSKMLLHVPDLYARSAQHLLEVN